MTKYLIPAFAAFAMMSGAVLAQTTTSDTTTSTQSTVQVPAPTVGTYSTSKSQQTIDSSGRETDKSQTYSNDGDGTKATSTTKTTAPDGSQIKTSHEEQRVSPLGGTTTIDSTSATTKSGY